MKMRIAKKVYMSNRRYRGSTMGKAVAWVEKFLKSVAKRMEQK